MRGLTSSAQWLLLVVILVVLMIPANYVALTPTWGVADQLALVVSGIVGIVAVTMTGAPVVVRLAVPLLVLIIIQVVAGSDPITAASFFLPVFVGFAAALVLKESQLTVFLVTAILIISLSTAVDFVARGTPVSNFFGVPLRSLIDLRGFRARGVVGQPVPAALLTTVLWAVLCVRARSLSTGNRRRWLYVVVTLALGLTLLTTGTRSALLTLLVLVGLLLIVAIVSHRHRPLRVQPSAALGALGVIVVLVPMVPFLFNRFGSLRVFSFAELQGTNSVAGRLFSLTVLEDWQKRCDLVCKVVGSGPRALESDLSTSSGILGLSSVDNLLVTVLWDFGLLGVLVLGMALLVALKVVMTRRGYGDMNIIGAIGVIGTLVSGFAYDALYTRPVLVTFGLFLVLLVRRSDEGLVEVRPDTSSLPSRGVTPAGLQRLHSSDVVKVDF